MSCDNYMIKLPINNKNIELGMINLWLVGDRK